MNKKLLLTAIGAAMTATIGAPAYADVKVGGHAQVEIAQEGGTGVTDTITVEDNSRGRFWITADEDLGAGMKGLAHFEFRLDTTGSCELEGAVSATSGKCSTDANSREKYVGLQSGFGTIKLGSIRSPYKYAGGVLWDAFVTTNLEARGNGGMSANVFGHNNFMDNSINYTSPTFGGLVFAVAYSPDDATALTGSTADEGDYSASLEWKGAGLHVIAARAVDNDGSNTGTINTDQYEANKLGIRADLGILSIMAQYEMLETDSGLDTNVIFAGLQAKFGNITGVLQAGVAEDDPTGAEATYLAVGGFYNFSKTFSAFTGYRQTEVEVGGASTDADVITLGLRKVF